MGRVVAEWIINEPPLTALGTVRGRRWALVLLRERTADEVAEDERINAKMRERWPEETRRRILDPPHCRYCGPRACTCQLMSGSSWSVT